MERMERRAITRVSFPSKGLIVVCDTQEIIHVEVTDLSPLGIGVIVSPDVGNLVGREIIMVGETLIMFADVVRQITHEDGSQTLGLSAKKFTKDVLQFLFDSIEDKIERTNEQEETER